jgi:hypothetical protein
MNVYIISSWKNIHAVELLTDKLREIGCKVNSFVENSGDEEVNKPEGLDTWVNSSDGEDKFNYDTHHATSDDLCIYISPSGMDAGAEIGAAWASNIPVFGLSSKAEQLGLMRRMVTWFNSYKSLYSAVLKLKNSLEV